MEKNLFLGGKNIPCRKPGVYWVFIYTLWTTNSITTRKTRDTDMRDILLRKNRSLQHIAGLMTPFIIIATISILSIFCIAGCDGKDDDKLVITMVDDSDEEKGGREGERGEGTLTVLCWEGLIPDHLEELFEREFDISVEVEYMWEQFDLIETLESEPDRYDLIIVDDFMITFLRELGLISRLNKSNIPNIDRIDPIFYNMPYDDDRNYSVPFMWWAWGIVYNSSYISEEDVDWYLFFDDNLDGKIDMPEDIFINILLVLKYMGESINERSPEVINEAADLLLEQEFIVGGYFSPPETIEHLIDEISYLAFLVFGDAFIAIEENPDIRFRVPESGVPLWMISWVVPAGSENKDNAELFVNFLLEPINIAEVSNYMWAANTVGESRFYIHEELIEIEEIFLPEYILMNCELPVPPSDELEENMGWLWNELIGEDYMEEGYEEGEYVEEEIPTDM